jgi:hypothetical protein
MVSRQACRCPSADGSHVTREHAAAATTAGATVPVVNDIESNAHLFTRLLARDAQSER